MRGQKPPPNALIGGESRHTMQTSKKPRYSEARRKGEVLEQSGYHQPRDSRCGCSLDTAKGAYRDVSVAMPDGRVIHYYHQSPVVIDLGDGRLRLDSCGYRTSTTKERINDHLPSGYYVTQQDFTWYLLRKDKSPAKTKFEDGVVVDV